jgi:aldehyde dehydrogenase (NAD+)
MTLSIPTAPDTATPVELTAAFEALQARRTAQRALSAKQRIQRIERLYAEISRRRADIQAAMHADFRKPAEEVDLTEIYVLKSEMKAIKRGLRGWMREQRVPGGLAMVGSASWIRPEAKGVALIIAPWNYPLQLLFRPLMSAIAAGCPAFLKPSELTPHVSAICAEIVSAVFPPEEVFCVQGGVAVSQHLLDLPFDHIYFTGSPAVGRKVMAAAAAHPCSVTLELGGKSPVIIDETANVEVAARRLVWAKLLNAGQICVAPDYVLVHTSQREAFLTAVQRAIRTEYGTDPSASPDFQRIVNRRHTERIGSLIDDAVTRGAQIVTGGEVQPDTCYVAPTIIVDVATDAAILEEEIFGPVLPVLTYDDIDEACAAIESRPTPLALYIYSKSRKRIRHITARLQSGGVSINNSVVHVSSTALPFGGLGNSGVGVGHGEFGFREFTHFRGMFQQLIPGAAELLTPPYNNTKRRLIQFVMKWL